MGAEGKKSKDNARERLLEAGLDVFGRFGYEQATTRRITRQAGVNIAAIPYYFGGKQGLYGEVVSYVIGAIVSHLESTIQEIDLQKAAGPPNASQALALLLNLLAVIIEFMIGSPQAQRFARIILREQLDPSDAYDIIFKRLMSPVLDTLAGLIAAATQTPLSDASKLRALALMGQIMAFRFARETVVRALHAEGYSAKETETIRQIILEQTEAAILGIKK
ncbi:MAG: hypothetical protein VR64_09335 [Desulfatitalea sp. BRH_c12]|nr:MAG: hypothetical protein VR64_09335 [Desulfatitalea sp. BRH_c12]